MSLSPPSQSGQAGYCIALVLDGQTHTLNPNKPLGPFSLLVSEANKSMDFHCRFCTDFPGCLLTPSVLPLLAQHSLFQIVLFLFFSPLKGKSSGSSEGVKERGQQIISQKILDQCSMKRSDLKANTMEPSGEMRTSSWGLCVISTLGHNSSHTVTSEWWKLRSGSRPSWLLAASFLAQSWERL